MTKHARFAILAIVILAGCATDPAAPPRRYLLDYPALGNATLLRDAQSPSLIIGQVAVAPFLSSNGIVYQTAENTISVASQHRWAEPIQRQLRRGLFTALVRRLDHAAVFVQPPGTRSSTARLSVSLHAFHGRYTGDAVVAGIWRLTGAQGSILIRRRFRLVRPLPADGYDALVHALSQTWQEIAAGIASRVEPLLASP